MQNRFALVRRGAVLFALAACLGPPCLASPVQKTAVAAGPASLTTSDMPDRIRPQAIDVSIPAYFAAETQIASADRTLIAATAGQDRVAVSEAAQTFDQRQPGRQVTNGPNADADLKSSGERSVTATGRYHCREGPAPGYA